MDNAVTQEVFKRIDALAEKLGVTAAYLWPKLVAWEYGKALGGILSSVAGIVLSGIVLQLLLPRTIRAWQEMNDEVSGVGGSVICLLVGGFGLFAAANFVFGLEKWIATLVSPEAAAFYNLVGK